MKVKALRNVMHDGRIYIKDDAFDVEEKIANSLVERKFVEAVVVPQKAASQPKTK